MAEYNFISSNVVSQEETNRQIEGTLQFLADTLSKTLGPYGSTTIMQDRMLQHSMSKDGYTVLKGIAIKEDLPRTIFDLVKNVSKSLVRTVGDGSTSSIIVSNFLFKELNSLMKKYRIAPKDMVDILNESAKIFSDKIRAKSTRIDDDNFDIIKTIASVSTNNDATSGKLVHEVFSKIGRHGYVTLQGGKKSFDEYEITSGTEVHRGYIHEIYVNKEDKKTCELDQPLIFMANDLLTEQDLPMLLELVTSVVNKYKRPLVIVAKDFDGTVKTFFHENKMKLKNDFPVVILDIPVANQKLVDKYDDLAVSLGCDPFNKAQGEQITEFAISRLGSCSKVVVTDIHTKFVKGAGDASKIQERIESIQKTLEEVIKIDDFIDRDEDIENLKKRTASLQSSMAVIYVGGNTEQEKKTRMYLIEDAIYAVKSALEHGYVIGGNLVLPRILSQNDETTDEIVESISPILSHLFDDENELVLFLREYLQAIKNAFSHSYVTVLRNGYLSEEKIAEIVTRSLEGDEFYNLKTRKYESDNETVIINSAQTDIEIIRATFSIIGLLATSNQFLTMNIPVKQ